ncbi:MAG: amino acid adenylation domain-containing protein [Scytonematopsis contorta HA4267-MV1]|jgi:amino acid adenylation domain-containing protein/non-ribosomal peptide synthase protein (TIGR01720 family)|nr:amino acid adenylation domain-containing protein [Scytonematopsis contorta HA4267-MV1]
MNHKNSLNQQITNLSPEKRALLELKLQNKKNKNTNTPQYEEIPKISNRDSVPLSFSQERLWFLEQLETDNPFYNIPGTFLLKGNLNLKVLQQSLSEIIRRHEVLRTSFQIVNGTPVQVINQEATTNINLVDLQQHSEKERQTLLQQLVQKEAITPFNLEVAPFIRCTLVQMSSTEYVLLLTMHHIISDAWSVGVLIQELSSLYKAFCEGRPSPLPELPIQYADFAVWQRQQLSGSVLETQLNYWQEHLTGASELLQLSTDRSRPSVQTYQGATQSFTLNTDITQKLQTLSHKSNSTLFMTLQAAFATLLYRYTGQPDILIGSPIANRNRSEIESLIGFFVNTLVLRSRFEDNPSFESLLAQVRKTTIKAYENQDVSFEQVVEVLQPQRSLSHSPLFQVMFALQNAPIGKLELPAVTLSKLEQENTIAKLDLTVSMTETSQGLVGEWEYNTDLFDASTIKQMAGHFHNLLSAIVENPQQAVNELPLLNAAERHHLLTKWDDTANKYPTDKCIHQLFEQQVENRPDAIAVVFEKEQLTYQQLNQRANQLAHHLLSLGVGPEVLVGICVEHSVEMVVGLLGILKAGGAYVPLDPNYPEERLSYMLEDSGVEVLLTQQKLLSSLPSRNAQVVCLDSDWGAIEQHSQNNPDTGFGSENLAYVIYTSGSTGQPKGVLIEHKNVVRLFAATQSWYHFNANDVWTNFHSIAFDFSVWEIWGGLCHGGRLVIVPYWLSRDTESFYNLLCSENVTVLNQTPSAFHQLINVEKNVEKFDDTQPQLSLRLVIFGGEALELQILKSWFEQHGDQTPQLVNMYGITETTVHVTYRPLTMADLNSTRSVIGRPVRDLQMYILDENLEPVPTGVTGQMYVGGEGLARGYLNRQQLSRERFIPNPFNHQQESRLYKTGDLARYLPNGDIEYLGRIDNQVKILGFRIELGEIEAVLNTHPQIQQAVVIATEDILGNKRLVAYVVTTNLTPHQLREFLKPKLPEYMMPSVFVTLDTLPLTANGKIDRKALPAPDGEISREQEYVAPRTKTEKILTNIWQELLLKEKVSIHDNLFEIGGDSILSIQVVSRAKNSGIQITPQQIFQNQTIIELASVANTTATVIAQQGIVTGVAPLTPIQHWFFAKNKQEVQHFNQSVLLQVPNYLQTELIERALKKLLEHHDALRLRFTSVVTEQTQTNHVLDDVVPFTVVDLSSTPPLEQAQALSKIATEYQASLNLSDGRLMQVVMFNLGKESDARLLIIIHHLAVDGLSWRILLSDLQTIYQQLITQQPIQLSAKTTAFIDWAKKLNSYAQSEIIKQELDYWLNKDWSLTTPLPFDNAYTQQENTVGSAASVSVKLSVEETQALLGSVNETYNTQINDILLSALAISLASWTTNSNLLIDLEGHGREELFLDVDLSRTVGWFTSLFPVLLQLPKLDQLSSVIKSIKEQLRGIPNRGIGYGILRYLCEDTSVKQQLQTITTPEICFNYLGQFDQLKLPTDWKIASESTGTNQSLQQNRSHLLDINALVVEGELQMNWTYSSNVHTHTTIENLANSYMRAIRSIIEHCRSENAFEYTPSDFPLAQLNQKEIDNLLAEFKTEKIESIYPLSPMQQGMLFHSLYAPESGVYFEQMTFNIKGNINFAAFKSAWEKVLHRHSVLRTFFVWENRQTPLQIVLKQVNFPWNNLDWQGLSSTEQQQQLKELLQTQREQGFQFNQAPLMECTLIKLSEDTYTFIWNHHHILIDGWCLPILFKEVLSFYQASLEGETLYLPTPRPYEDYIAWLHSQDKKAAIEFWQKTLQGFKAPTSLVVDKPKSQKQQKPSDYKQLELRLSAQVSHQLQSVVQQHRITLSTIVQAAWGLLLSRYNGEENVVFGVTVSGRTGSLSGVENMVGLLINTLPLRLQISPQQQIVPWLEQIQQLMLELQQYSYTPLFEIQAMSELPGGTSLFESLLVFENYPIDSSLLDENGSLQLSKIEGFEQTNYPLTLAAIPESELLIKINYDALRFEEENIGRMLGHLQTIFSAIVENPQQTVGELPLLTAAEHHQLLSEWNDTTKKYPTDKCIHQLFEQQVEKTPDAIAVVFEKEQLTYQQLNQRANHLAHYLKSLGVRPEVLVGICIERSLEMIVGLLGILKAGGAYVPLDPAYPKERLDFILCDSQISVLLTQQKLLDNLVDNLTVQNIPIVCLDKKWETIQKESQVNPQTNITPKNLAYVIYTSGSTGKPKGVAIEHHSPIALFYWAKDIFTIEDLAGVLASTSICFDLSVFELFLPLSVGGKVILAENALSLPILPAVQEVTLINTVPSAIAELVRSSSIPASVRTVNLAGEPLQNQLVQKIYKQETIQRVFNLYGPSEDTTYSTFALVKKGDSIVTIGRPISNTQVYLLDEHLQPVPIGVSGELYIGGDSLARGYFNHPQLTEEKFIPNPFSNSKSERLYKTGDLARYLPDGNIEFLGRLDYQVKIRGFRIELGEIEAVLNTHPQIRQAVVTTTEDILNNKRLVAYVVASDEIINTEPLRELLKQKLPEYMIPSAFVTLDTLPLTANGKVDRKALKPPELPPIKPATFNSQTEQILAQIWAEVLVREAVHPEDNFFEIGGDSIISLQIISRAREAGLEVELKDIFEAKTLSRLADVARSVTEQVVISEPVTGKVPLAPIQRWFFERNLPHPHHWNQNLALEVKEPLDIVALQLALATVIAQHDIFRLQFCQDNEVWQQSYSGPAAKPELRVEDFTRCHEAQQVELLEEIVSEEQALLSLERPPLLRLLYVKNLQQYGNVLYLFAHHLIVDGVSWRILVEDLERAYELALQGQSISLPARTSSYRQWTTSLEKLANSPEIEADISFWQDKISHPHGNLPVDYQAQGKNTVDSLAIVSVQMSSDRTRTLLTQTTASYRATIQEILLTALLATITQWSGSDSLLVDLEGHGREDIGSKLDLSRTVGWFTSLYPVLLRGTKNSNQEQLLKQVKEQMRAIPHSGQSYGMLRYLSSDASFRERLCRQKAQISFNYLGQIDSTQKKSKFFQLSNAPTGVGMFAGQELANLLAVNALVQNESLQLNWSYSQNIYRAETIEALARNYLDQLGFYLESINRSSDFYSVSDFSLVELSDGELNSILEKFEN